MVIALVSTLVAIAMVGYGTAVTRAREAVLKEDLFRMRDAIDQYHADRTVYPPALESLVAEGYLRAIPEDPFTQSTATWQVVLAEYDPADPLVPGRLRHPERVERHRHRRVSLRRVVMLCRRARPSRTLPRQRSSRRASDGA